MAVDPKLREELLRLPVEQRAQLAAELLRSLEGEDDEDFDPVAHEKAWADEIQHRLRQVDSGEVETIPWSVVRERLRRP